MPENGYEVFLLRHCLVSPQLHFGCNCPWVIVVVCSEAPLQTSVMLLNHTSSAFYLFYMNSDVVVYLFIYLFSISLSTARSNLGVSCRNVSPWQHWLLVMFFPLDNTHLTVPDEKKYHYHIKLAGAFY